MGADVQVNGIFCKMFVEKSKLNQIFYTKVKIKMSDLSYFSTHLCKNVGCAKAAPRLVAGGVGWADVHVFFTKMKANSYKMFGKINFKLFL